MAGLILFSPSSSSLEFQSKYGLDEVIWHSSDIAESVTWAPWLSSSLLAEGDSSESGYLPYSSENDDFVQNNILDFDNSDKPRSTFHQRQVHTAFSEAPRPILKSTDGTALVQLGKSRSSSLSSTTSYLSPVRGFAPVGHLYVDRSFRTELGNPQSSSGTSTTAYRVPVRRLYPYIHVDERYPGQENISISNNGIRWVVQHSEKNQKHHDVESSNTDVVVPLRQPASYQLQVEGRQINVNDIKGQDESEPQALIRQLHSNVHFAVQAALAQSARRKQRQAVMGGDEGALACSESGGGSGYRSATRAYIERAESWFGEDVLIKSLNQMIQRQGQGTKGRKRKPQQHLGQLQRPVSLTVPLPWSRSLPTTQEIATILNSPSKRAHSPDLIGCIKRRRCPKTSSAVSSDEDGLHDHEEDGGEVEEEESKNDYYNLETYASLLQKLIKGKSAMSSDEIQKIQVFISSSHITDLIISVRGSSANAGRTNTIANANSDYESTIYQSILYIAKSSMGELGLAKDEEDKLRRGAKRVVRKT